MTNNKQIHSTRINNKTIQEGREKKKNFQEAQKKMVLQADKHITSLKESREQCKNQLMILQCVEDFEKQFLGEVEVIHLNMEGDVKDNNKELLERQIQRDTTSIRNEREVKKFYIYAHNLNLVEAKKTHKKIQEMTMATMDDIMNDGISTTRNKYVDGEEVSETFDGERAYLEYCNSVQRDFEIRERVIDCVRTINSWTHIL